MTSVIGRRGPRRVRLRWRRSTHSARSERIEFSPEFPAAAIVTAPGCRMCFLRRPGEAVASVVHPPQTLSLVPTEVHGFSASHWVLLVQAFPGGRGFDDVPVTQLKAPVRSA